MPRNGVLPNPPDIFLLERVVTLAAISCPPDRAYRLNILAKSRQCPWLLLNLRNPDLISILLKDAPDSCRERLITLLFLVLYALICRDSTPLADQYFAIIAAEGELPLYISALTAIAPYIGHDGLSEIGTMLAPPRTQELNESGFNKPTTVQEELLKMYDLQLGASVNPGPNIFATLLMLSKYPPSGTTEE